jgi:hypothetical protein
MLAGAILRTPGLPSEPRGAVSTEALGAAFLTQYVLAFEVLSVLLLVAALGAIVMARRKDAGEEGEAQRAVLPARKPLPPRAHVTGGEA